MIVSEEDYLAHYGTPRKSGRYPWGSGGEGVTPQRSRSFFDHVKILKDQGLTESQIAEGMGLGSTTELRAMKSIAKNAIKQDDINTARRLKDKGMSNMAIGKQMEKNESSVRSLLAPGQQEKVDVLKSISEMLKLEVAKRTFVDIGVGVENHLGIAKDKLATAVAMLKLEGYEVHNVDVDQLGTAAGNKTKVKVLAAPGTTYVDVAKNKNLIQQLGVVMPHSEDGGRSWFGIETPLNVSSKRVEITYAEDGGSKADGVIYVRRGVTDVSLGGSSYAQVRIAVDGTHYLKGMAMYKDDLPPGVDLQFNTNKSKFDPKIQAGGKLAAMKPMVKDNEGNIDKDNPFGAVLKRQIGTDNPDGTKTLTSVMNVVNEEGSWGEWKKSISSQVLSKQSPVLAKNQLEMTFDRKKSDLEEILTLTNPAVRRKLLESYADGADSSAVELKAASLPRQASHVILPIDSMKPTEIYAPNYRNGERVALIRYPHGGTFEIPELTVNNNQPEAKALLGRAPDAVGINHAVAQHLSGADFDGDTVLVIPNPVGNPKLKTTSPLEKLKGFDPQAEYPGYEGMVVMDSATKGMQMGLVSNLITDMTIKGAGADDLSRAVRHSMVVIDAEKHGLNYKQSAIDRGIPQLMKKYQDRSGGGSSTLISRATSPAKVLDRRPRRAQDGGPIDKATGKKMWEPTGESWIDKKTGKTVFKMKNSVKLAETDDAHTLVSKDGGTKIERVYADHSNKLKSLANQARKEMVATPNLPYSPSAKKVYKKEVDALNAALNLAVRNKPLERQAQLLANATLQMKKDSGPPMDSAELKRVKFQALEEARRRVGADKHQIKITPEQWLAIQAGAITNHKLESILNNADLDLVKALATPRTKILMSSSKKTKARAMANAGYTQAEIADALGVSLTTLKEGMD